MDLLWDGADARDLVACVRSAERRAMEHGLHHLAVLLPSGSEEAAEFVRLGYRPVGFGLTLVARSFRSAVGLEWLVPRFYFTYGDFDLV